MSQQGVSPNLLILSRKLEVPLDVVTERSPVALPLKAEYALAVQKRMASSYDLARRHLSKVSVRQKRNNDKQLTGRPSLLVILFGYITFGGRRRETPNLTVIGKDLNVVGCGRCSVSRRTERPSPRLFFQTD